ncbi:MotE family protein [Kyrpidia tusciae]|uniref:MgtE intracellular region n=1 Tax=Kyrpidia tusciae (strain DSM 2912 / NBRC 15312 / T2) TaxID=562970 RepID=D5WPF3_KYRT2|nr:MgtE integral membrane protein [Kyrpidia tusciae]ADG06212.1 MgtE intracellular region [Kyrpidia tusciae DSM 2912]
MTARLSLRWMIAVAAMALVLTLLLSGIVLSLLGFPVVTRVKNTALGVVQGLFPTNRPTPAAGAQAEIDALRAQVSALQAQLDDAKRHLQQTRASAQGSGNPGGAPGASGPGGTALGGAAPGVSGPPGSVGGAASEAGAAGGGTAPGVPSPIQPGAAQDVNQVYRSMVPTKAAAILQQMTPQEAAAALQGLSTDDRAAILEKMDPKTAAAVIQIMGRAGQ